MTSPPLSPPQAPRDPFSALPKLDRHKPKCGPVRPSKSGRKRAYVLLAVHVLFGLHLVHWLTAGTTLTPVEPSEAGELLAAGKLNAGFVLFVVLIAGTLVFGRWFCGWACHVVALQDLCAWALGKLGLRPRPVRSRILVLAPFLVAFEMFVRPPLQRWLAGAPAPAVHAEFTTTEFWETFPGPVMGVATFVVVGFLVVWWLGAKGFCTYGCPYGAFFAVADRFAPGKIRVTDACDACGHCTSVCTSNVRVHEEVAMHGMVVDPACMKCMDCVSVCPKDALFFGLGAPKPFATSQQRAGVRADFTWFEECAMALLAYGAVLTFRGAWLGSEGIPFLMAVGLGVMTAVLAVVGLRLLRRREVTFQYAALKRDGRLTRAGRLVAVAIAAWLAFGVHTAASRTAVHLAVEEASVPLRALFARERQIPREEHEQALARVEAAAAWALDVGPKTHEVRGLLLRELGRHAEAEAALREATSEMNGMMYGEVALAVYRVNAGDFAEALRLAKSVLRYAPDNATAREIVTRLEGPPR